MTDPSPVVGGHGPHYSLGAEPAAASDSGSDDATAVDRSHDDMPAFEPVGVDVDASHGDVGSGDDLAERSDLPHTYLCDPVTRGHGPLPDHRKTRTTVGANPPCEMCGGKTATHLRTRLAATTTQRDAPYAIIRRLRSGWLHRILANQWEYGGSIRKRQGKREPMTPAEAAVLDTTRDSHDD